MVLRGRNKKISMVFLLVGIFIVIYSVSEFSFLGNPPTDDRITITSEFEITRPTLFFLGIIIIIVNSAQLKWSKK